MSLPRGSDTARRTERRQAKQLKKPTSLDVARLVGVSQSAVSRAFTEGGRVSKKTRERILKAAKEIGYVPNLHASSLITRRTGMIALIMGDITNPFYPEVLETFARRLQSAGKRVMLLRLSRDEPIDWALPHVLQYQVDGIIIATAMPGQSVRELCARAHAPVVLFNRAVSGVPVDAVCCDNSAGGRIVADILLDSGHKRFGFIAGLEGASTSGSAVSSSAFFRGPGKYPRRRMETSPMKEASALLLRCLCRRDGRTPYSLPTISWPWGRLMRCASSSDCAFLTTFRWSVLTI
jgi:hypothetical protein